MAEARADAVRATHWIRQRERIVRCEANAAYNSISNGDYVQIAITLAVTVADFGSCSASNTATATQRPHASRQELAFSARPRAQSQVRAAVVAKAAETPNATTK